MHKISKLNMKSLTETNSGKLITIVSGDIQSIERPLALVSIFLAAPFINIVAYIVIGFTSGWGNCLTVFLIGVSIFYLQHIASKKLKDLKGKESRVNDERQKYVNDMIVGARTIKAYGWENHYLEKIKGIRKFQANYVFWQGGISFLGMSVFQNGGLIATLAIFIP
jgi:ABC-type multidrug transport system fused ATPase/permease subunit